MCYRTGSRWAWSRRERHRRGRWRRPAASPKFTPMDHDSTDNPQSLPKASQESSPETSRPPKQPPGSLPDLPPEGLVSADVDPATSAAEEDEEARLPEVLEEPADAVGEGPPP